MPTAPHTGPVVTRFAPSPTGVLHIGGARTALFNWLYARHHGGCVLLRVEDTDHNRSTPEAIAAIVAGLDWLELDHDGDVVFQSRRRGRHREVAELLLASGHAYCCSCTPERLDRVRAQARAAGRPARYDGHCRDAAIAPAAGTVVRFRGPDTGASTVHDRVRGAVSVDNAQLDDLILLRADGSPTYMLCVVADDHDMGITHVIRGEDHLTNAVRQSQIYAALQWRPPVFAHVPLIHGADGAKLSKRHGAISLEAYRSMGYLPAAMRNALARLGWSHGDDEVFSTMQAVEWFTLEAVGRSPARFDPDKLLNLNALYIRQADDAALAEAVAALGAIPGLEAQDLRAQGLGAQVLALMPGLKPRARTLLELADGMAFLFAPRPLRLDRKARALLTPEARAHLQQVAARLQADGWNHDALEAAVRGYAEDCGLKLGAIAQPLRAALTGQTTSPGIFDVLLALGPAESHARLRDQGG